MNQNRFARFGFCAHDQGLVGREIGHAKSRALGERQPLMQWEDVNGLCHNVLGICAGIATSHKNSLTNGQTLDVGPDALDVPGRVTAGNIWQIRKSTNNLKITVPRRVVSSILVP
jgi:hypothetical protein